MRKHMKKVIAFLCAIALLTTSFVVDNLVNEPVQVKAADTLEPISVGGYENVTIKDFSKNGEVMPEGEYPCTDATSGNNSFYALTDGTSLNKKLLSMNVKFSVGNGIERLDVAGSGEWSGLMVYPSGDGKHLFLVSNSGAYGTTDEFQSTNIEAAKVGVSNFLDNEFMLQLAFDFGKANSSNKADIAVVAYVNGMVGASYTFTNCNMGKFGGYFGVYRQGESTGITLSSVTWPAEPVWPEGFHYVTLKNFSGLKAGVYEGTTAGVHADGAAIGLSNFDKTMLSMKVTFTGSSYRTRLDIGGNAGWTGLSLEVSGDGKTLFFADTYSMATAAQMPNMQASVAGVESFIGEPFLLQLSFEYGEVVDNRADLTLGVYINGKLYNNEHFSIADCNMQKTGSHMAFYGEQAGLGVTLENVIAPIEPVSVKGFGNLTISDFEKESGEKLMEGLYPGGGGAHSDYMVKGLTNFDKKLISMNVNLKGQTYKNSIIIGGNGGWCGFNIHPHSNGSQLVIDRTWAGNITSTGANILYAETAGLNSFMDNEFLLQISFEYTNVVDGKADLKLGIYIDGKLYNNEVITITSCNMNYAGTHMALYRETANESMAIGREVEFDEFAGYDIVTIRDFADESGKVMEEKAYECSNPTGGVMDGYTLADKGITSFDAKVLSMKVKFKHNGSNPWNTRLYLAGAGAWKGLSFYTNGTGSHLIISDMHSTAGGFGKELAATTAGIDSFLDQEFLLQLTFDYGDYDSDGATDDYELGVYINGKLYNDEKWVVSNCTSIGTYLGLYRQADISTIIVGSYDKVLPADPGIQPSGRYEKLTFGHFGIVNKKYPAISGDLAVQGKASGRDTLDKTVICGDILYEGSNSSQIIWGGKSGWDGLRMFPSSGGTMGLTWYKGSTGTDIATLKSDIAGVDFVGEKYSIMLSSELIDADNDGNVNDIMVGIWFNGVLYNQQYFLVPDKGAEYGNWFSIYCAKTDDVVTFGNVMDLLEQPGANLTKVSFSEFDVADGAYGHETQGIGAFGRYLYGDTVNGVVLCGTVKFNRASENDELDLLFGGSGDDVWSGARLMMASWTSGKQLALYTNGVKKTFELAKAGLGYLDKEFELMWSLELVDHAGDGNVNDLKVGVWFDGFLYENAYIYVDEYGTSIGDLFGTYASGESLIELGTINKYSKLPNEDFDKITFSDFGLESGKIVCGADVVASSKAKAYQTFDRVVFSGDFRISDTGNYQIIYGGDGAWGGLRLMIDGNGNLNGSWYKGNDSQLVIWGNPGHLGLHSLTKDTFNLKISTELVDDDGDGKKNDIKIGIWFNNRLYYYEGSYYHIVKDWGDQLKNGFSIYGAKGEAVNVLIRNVAEFQANPNYYEDISSYRGAKNTAPEAPEGYVFGGWFTDDTYGTPIEASAKSGSAWAKFVDDEALTVRAQVKVSDGKVSADKTSMRFITTVDSLNYQKVGFLLAKENEDGSYGAEKDTATTSANGRVVYEKLYAVGSTSSTITYKPTIFSWMSDYFKTFTLNNIPSSEYGVSVKATPYWVTKDGTVVKGEAREICVDDYKTSNNSSNAYSYDFLGEDTMPIAGYFGPYPASNPDDSKLVPDYNTEEYFKMVADSGVNLLVYSDTDYDKYPATVIKQLEMGEKYGIGIHVKDSGFYNLSEEEMMARIGNYSDYASFCGMYLVDEPGTNSYVSSTSNGLASSFSDEAAILSKYNIMYYANMYPIVDVESNWWEGILGSAGINDKDKTAYGKYINEFDSALNTDVLSYDFYPFDESRKNKNGNYDLNLYFWNMNAIREKAVATEKPFWAFVQAGGQWNDKQEYFNSSSYYPSKGQFNWIANTSLAFGAQGIQYFPLVQPQHFAYAGTSAEDKMWDFDRNGLIGSWGNKTQWYYYAQELNQHIAEIDNVLMNSSLMALVTTGNATNAVSGLSGDIFETDPASYGYLTDAPDGLMIGIFDYCGRMAFYVVNYDYASAKNVTLPFEGECEFTISQKAVTTEMTADSVTFNMEPGEGVLLVFE